MVLGFKFPQARLIPSTVLQYVEKSFCLVYQMLGIDQFLEIFTICDTFT